MFTNPIGGVCLKTELNLINCLKAHHQKPRINLVPITNIQVVTDYLRRNHLDLCNLVLRNQIMNITYQSMLDFKAASFQGNKKARAFTMSLQKHLALGIDLYSETLLEGIIDEVKLDAHCFWNDRQSQLAKDLCEADRRLAINLGVTKTPSTVFVDYRRDPNGEGVLVSGKVTTDLINQILDGPDCDLQQIRPEHQQTKLSPMNSHQHQILHLV